MSRTVSSLRRRVRLAGLLVSAVLTAACVSQESPGPDAQAADVQVAATVAPHAWLVEQIAGDDFHVVSVLPTTADPHSHTPTDAEVSRLAGSRVLFRAGVPFENGSWLQALTAQGVRLIDLRHGVELLDDHHGHSHHGHGSEDGTHDEDEGSDPHTWTSPQRLAQQTFTVEAALAELRPERAVAVEERASRLRRQLAELDAELKARLAELPGREFYVHHPSWSYFAADYGLEQVALEAGGSEPTDAQLTAWLRRARDVNARVVFTQPQTADRSARGAADALSMRVETLDPLAPDVPTQLRVTAERLLAAQREP